MQAIEEKEEVSEMDLHSIDGDITLTIAVDIVPKAKGSPMI